MSFYLKKISQVWYFRQRVPKDLVKYFNRTEIRKTLKSRKYSDAKYLVKSLLRITEMVFKMLRSNMLTDDQIKQLVSDYLKKMLDFGEICRTSDFDDNYPDSLGEWKDFFLVKNRFEEIAYRNGPQHVNEMHDKFANVFQEKLANHDFRNMVSVACLLLRENNLPIEMPSCQFDKLCRELLKTEVIIHHTEAERTVGNYHSEYVHIVNAMLSVTPTKEHQTAVKPAESVSITPSTKLSQLMAQFFYEKESKGTFKPTTRQKYEGMNNTLIELLGDVNLNTLDRATMVDLLNKLKKYPSHRTKRYIGKSLIDISKLDNVVYLSDSSVNDHMSHMSTLLNYAITNQICGVTLNHAAKLQLPKNENPSDLRDVFTPQDIANIFKALAKINVLSQPERFWIPLMALFLGARSNELCQLYIENIFKDEDGVWCLRIENNPSRKQTTKNKNSIRVIPIHPTLIKLGLIKFVQSQLKKGEQRLWTNLNLSKEDKYNKEFGKWFNRGFIKFGSGIEKGKKSFHSTRHTFIDWFKKNSLIEDRPRVKQLVGHFDEGDMRTLGGNDITWDLYGKKFIPKDLYKTLKKLDYGIDLALLGKDIP